jgi:aspartyl-tRNA synthetase
MTPTPPRAADEAIPLETLGDWTRTHTLGELTRSDADQNVVLMGWVHRVRDHGGVMFLDLRDRDGVTQVVVPPDRSAPEVVDKARAVGSEWVVAVRGQVVERPADAVNAAIPTGEIEVHARELKILNRSETPPFPVADDIDVGEEIRLKYRYLDLRRSTL